MSALLDHNRRLRAAVVEAKQLHDAQLRALRAEMAEKLEAAQAKVADEADTKKMEFRLASAKKLAAASKTKIEQLDRQVHDLREENAQLLEGFEAAEQDLVDRSLAWEDEQKALEVQIGTLQAELSVRPEPAITQGLNTQILELREANSQLLDRCRLLEQSLDASNNEWDLERERLEERLQAVKAEAMTNQMAFQVSATNKYDSLEAQISRLQSLNSRLSQELEGAVGDLERQTQSRVSLAAEVTSARTQLQTQGDELSAARALAKGLEAERDELLVEVDSLRNRSLEQRQAECDAAPVKERLQAAELENKELKAQLQARYKELEAAAKATETAEAVAFETRQKLLQAHNQVESAEIWKAGALKAERQAQSKGVELDQLRAQLAQSKVDYEELALQVKAIGEAPTGGSLSKFLGKLKRTSKD